MTESDIGLWLGYVLAGASCAVLIAAFIHMHPLAQRHRVRPDEQSAPTPVAVSLEIHTEQAREAQRCAFCHDDLGDGELHRCPRCATVLHLPCAREAIGCVSAGCREGR